MHSKQVGWASQSVLPGNVVVVLVVVVVLFTVVVVTDVGSQTMSSSISAILAFTTAASAEGIVCAPAYFVILAASLPRGLHALPAGICRIILATFLVRDADVFSGHENASMSCATCSKAVPGGARRP